MKLTFRSHKDLAGRPQLVISGGRDIQLPLPYLTYLACCLLAALLLSTWALTQGDYPLTPGQLLAALTGQGEELARYFVQEVRAPRILAALLVGASLGLSGAIFQTISENPLGSPDIIGFTQGAASGAICSIILWEAGPLGVGLGALAGGMATSLLVYLLTRQTELKGFRLVLLGLGLGATLSAFNSLLLVSASLAQAQTASSWLVGSLNAMNWAKLTLLALILLLALPALLLLSRPLGLLYYGESLALALGIRLGQVRPLALFTAVLLVSLATAVTGPLAFVALAAPHLARSLSRAQGSALAASAASGALLVLASDLLGLYLLPSPLQVGVVTGALGGIYLLYLMIRGQREGQHA